MKPLFPYFGGKGFLAERIISLFPKHNCYVEVFGGSAAVLLAKPPSTVEVYNDLNSRVVNFFRVLREGELRNKLIKRLRLTPFSKEVFNELLDKVIDGELGYDPIIDAWSFYAVSRMCFSGIMQKGIGWKHAATRNFSRQYIREIERFDDVGKRLMEVQIENSEWRKILNTYDSPDTLFYCDPPYLPETRNFGKKGQYQNEMTPEDHADLINVLKTIKGKVLLSGYKNELYDSLAWEFDEYDVPCKTSRTSCAENHRRTEVIWKNYICHPKLFAMEE